MKSEAAIRHEYRRCQRILAHLRGLPSMSERQEEDWAELRGIQQALGWALDDNAMAPLRAAGYPLRKPKAKRSPR